MMRFEQPAGIGVEPAPTRTGENINNHNAIGELLNRKGKIKLSKSMETSSIDGVGGRL
jgi:hypothetical protein